MGDHAEHMTRARAMLAGLKGRFILSLNDVPEVRETFGWLRVGE